MVITIPAPTGRAAKGWGVEIILDELTPALDRVRRNLKPMVAEAMANVGMEMVDLAQSIVPVDTGQLQASINSQVDIEPELNLTFFADTDYAAYVEFGTSRSRAQPYMRPALDANLEKLANAILQGCMDAFIEGKSASAYLTNVLNTAAD
jgi:HK97 gp10 family phage protein